VNEPSAPPPSVEAPLPEPTAHPSLLARGWRRFRALFPASVHPLLVDRGILEDFRAARSDLVRWLRRERGPLLLLAFASLIFTAVLAWFQVAWLSDYGPSEVDLGFYNQAFSTTAQYHQFFRDTWALPAGSNGYLFAGHFVPFFFLLVPFYSIAPGLGTLIVLKQAGLAVGCFPLFALAQRRLRSRGLALALGLLYLANPVVMQIDWIGFDPECFLPAALLLFLLMFDAGRFWPTVGAGALAMSIIETGAAMLAIFLVAAAICTLVRRRTIPLPRRQFVFAAIAGVGLLALVMVALADLSFLHFGQGIGTFSSTYAGKYTVLGASSLPDVYPYAILHPGQAWAALTYDGWTKLGLVLVLLGCFAFLPLVGDLDCLLAGSVALGLFLLGSKPSLYTFGDQYAAYPLPFLAAGAVGGIALVRTRLGFFPSDPSRERAAPRRERRRRRPVVPSAPTVVPVALALAGIVAASPFVLPLLPNPSLETGFSAFGPPVPSAEESWLNRVLSLIPPHASVLAIQELYPYVSSRPAAFAVPGQVFFRAPLTYGEAIRNYVNLSNYILLDFAIDWIYSDAVFTFANLSAFGTAASAQGLMLLERGWNGLPEVFAPMQLFEAGGSQTPVNSAVETNVTSPEGPTLIGPSNASGSPILWNGPGVTALVPGTYQATFWVGVKGGSATGPVQLRVNDTPDQVALSYQLHISEGYVYNFGLSRELSATVLTNTFLRATATPFTEYNVTVTFALTTPALVSTFGAVRAPTDAVRLFLVSFDQTAVWS
jgi:uncharacterized membrane protein